MLSLDLVKTRLSVMSMEMRKNFIQVIITSLIEKSPDPKILRSVVKIVEEWVKNNSPMAANQMPNLREKSILLVKMMTYIEKRFPDDLELNGQFLDLAHHGLQCNYTDFQSRLVQCRATAIAALMGASCHHGNRS
ncbi:hypothetical protein AALO_G00276230 [Alosa alosa]|uniref:Transformation/transcription domain-associated protein n=1 Tax=Alosa alosa TaxID=278164 RepID=A0AAV6FMU3_9TELE|nr:hypothetical protein AALO_G00276230 [Alosa alosa]